MPTIAPQRFLHNGLNLLRDAVLSASSVLAVSNRVIPQRTARSGRGAVVITGDYEGTEAKTIDVEIVDADVEIARISSPVRSGVGSATLTDITASGTAQAYTLECGNAGIQESAAKVLLEGVSILARATGTAGNTVRLSVDQSDLVFTPTDYSLLTSLPIGAGGEASPMTGAGFDWDCKVIDAQGQIPADAHRVTFGDDESTVYLSFKQFVSGAWQYRLVPSLQRALPAGTVVNFVTGGRTVGVTDGVSTESYSDIVTAFDLLDVLRTDSATVSVDGVVANDRSPTGQAARELALRTDAHAEPSSGTGSKYATGFVDVTVSPSVAATELITARCYAVSARDHPLAGLGRERWELSGSLSGALGTIVTGIPYADGNFGLTIPRKFPPGYGVQKGRFSVTNISMPRDAGVDAPSVCLNPLALGPEAIDQTITLTYKARPSGACDCTDITPPALNARCLGTDLQAEDSMAYSTEAKTRLIDLYDWAADVRDRVTRYVAGYRRVPVPTTDVTLTGVIDGSVQIGEGTTLTLDDGASDVHIPTNQGVEATGYADEAMATNFQDCVDTFERALQVIDEVTDTGERAAGFGKWDEALAVATADLDESSLGALGDRLASIAIEKYKLLLRKAVAYAGVSPLGKSDASSLESGDGCWLDHGDAYYWEVVGSDKGAYAPAFTNHPYTASRDNGTGKYYSTHEFGFAVLVQCPEKLKVGDQITLAIGDAGWGATYQQGDELTFAIVAAGPLYLTGGQDGSPVQTWYVTGSVDGPLPAYLFNPSAPAAYAGSPDVGFLLVPGGIASAKGDAFRFTVEGAHWRYRVNGGDWIEDSPMAPIADGAVDFIDGLSIEFLTGAAPSFVAGDVFSFRAEQPWAASNLVRPKAPVWKWDGATATLDFDFGSVQPIDTIALIHDLPEGATITVSGGDAAIGEWTESLTWRSGSVWMCVSRTARYGRISLADADGGSIRYAFVGEAIMWAVPVDWKPRRVYALDRAAAGLIQGGTFVAKAISGDVEFEVLTEDGAAPLEAMVDYAKAADDEPVIFIPQTTRTTEPLVFGHINADEVEFADARGYQPNVGQPRRVAARIPLSGVWR